MAVIPLYRDVLRVLQAVPPGTPVWPTFEQEVFMPHRAFFEGLSATYGPEIFGPGGLPAAVEQLAPALRTALDPAPSYGMEAYVQQWLDRVAPLLPGILSNVYLGVLFFLAPAATLSILGRPTVALGMERFHASPPPTPVKYWYHPREAEEMIPHESAHVARMQALNLPPTPRKLSLLDMVMLEGTALVFTDLLLGRTTLTTFMPAEQFAWHQANDTYVRSIVAADFHTSGMEAYLRYFSMNSPVSGYYVGYSICREYLDRFGNDAIRELISLPSEEILRRISGPRNIGDRPGRKVYS